MLLSSSQPELHGDSFVANGVHFDGYGDYMTVPNFGYAADASFTIGFWLTKERCSAQQYEFIFSHSERPAVNSQFSTPSSPLGGMDRWHGGGYGGNAPAGRDMSSDSCYGLWCDECRITRGCGWRSWSWNVPAPGVCTAMGYGGTDAMECRTHSQPSSPSGGSL